MEMRQDAPLYCRYVLVRMLLSYSRPVFFITLPISYCSHEFSFVFRDRFQQSLILCGIFPVISTLTSYSIMFLTNSQNCALRVYCAASSDNDKELYVYSLRNNPEERSSQLLRGRSMKSCIVNPSKTKLSLLYLKTQFVPRNKHFSSRL
jgi:hypothetical protein